MSDMKHDAIVGQGIPIHRRVEIPQDLIPADSMVEIGAKIAAGYFSGTSVTNEQLENIQGRGWSQDAAPQWEDIDVRNTVSCQCCSTLLTFSLSLNSTHEINNRQFWTAFLQPRK